MVVRLHWRLKLESSARPVIPGTEVAIRPSWEEMENGQCSVCVEGLMGGEWKVLQLVDGSLSNFESVADH